MADDQRKCGLSNDLTTTQIHDALVIAGRLLPKQSFFGSSMNVRILEIDVKELVSILSLLDVGLDTFGTEKEVEEHRVKARDCACVDRSLPLTAYCR